jgi:hypothetical protein
MRRLVLISVVVVGLLTAASAQAAKTQGLTWTPGATFGYGTLDAADGGSASQTFTLGSTGGKPVGPLSISLTGSSAFTKTADTCTGTKLSAKRSCSVTVKYAPTANGSDSATLAASAANTTGASDSLSGSSAWQMGDLTTDTQPGWAGASLLTSANFDNLYGGSFVIGTQPSFFAIFGSAADLLAYLPQAGPVGPFDSDLADPTTTSAGVFGGEVAALKLNIDFADAGLLTANARVKLGDLTICGLTTDTDLNGNTVRNFLTIANSALGGGSTTDSISDLYALTVELNGSFAAGPSTWAQDHLQPSSCT